MLDTKLLFTKLQHRIEMAPSRVPGWAARRPRIGEVSAVPNRVRKRVRAVQLRNNVEFVPQPSDKRHEGIAMVERVSERGSSIPWATELRAFAQEEPGRLIQTLTGAILGCGGWVLSRGVDDCGNVTLLFEFERRACVEIYCILIAAGLELTRSGHLRFTELCQCTKNSRAACGAEIASIDLQIQTCPAENPGVPESIQAA